MTCTLVNNIKNGDGAGGGLGGNNLPSEYASPPLEGEAIIFEPLRRKIPCTSPENKVLENLNMMNLNFQCILLSIGNKLLPISSSTLQNFAVK